MQFLNESTMKFAIAGVISVLAARYVGPLVGGFVKNNLLTGLVMILIGGFVLTMEGALMKGIGAGVVVAGASIVIVEVWPGK